MSERFINKNMILLYAVSTADELEAAIQSRQPEDGHCYLCTDNITYTGTLNGQSYTREFIQGEIITYTQEFGFSYPALQIPIQFRAWVAENFYNKRSIDRMIIDSGVGKVKTDLNDPKADYLENKFIETSPGIRIKKVDGHKLKIILDTQVAPFIGDNGNWYITDRNDGLVKDTGIKAAGTDGISLNYVGDFELNSQYKFNDSVRYQGKIYVAEADIESAEQTPDLDTENWKFMIEDGAKGDKGDKGDTGLTPDINFDTPEVSQTVGQASASITRVSGSTPENPVFHLALTGIKGEKGDKGDQGDAGESFEYLYYETLADAQGDISHIPDDSYIMITTGVDTGKVYSKSDNNLNLVTNLRGPQGQQGETGPTGVSITQATAEESQEPGGYNIITIHYSDDPEHVDTFRVRNGETGPRGKDFTVKKVYSSINEMWSDINNPEVALGEFVIINTDDVEDKDNAKLFIKRLDENEQLDWGYITDLSGAQGIQGPPGRDGSDGDPGIDGATWYTGTTFPTEDVLENDLFLNTSTGDIYKYDGESWSNSIGNIKGPSGDNGTKWYTGSSAPSGTFNLGDLFLNTSNYNVYAYGNSGWGSTEICNLKGANGNDGAMWFTQDSEPDSGMKSGDLWLKTSTQGIYKYNGSSWGNEICNIKGIQGVSVTGITARYVISTSGTTTPSSGWSTTMPAIEKGKYLWTEIKVNLSNNTTVGPYYTVAYSGVDGVENAVVYEGTLSATTYTISNDDIQSISDDLKAGKVVLIRIKNTNAPSWRDDYTYYVPCEREYDEQYESNIGETMRFVNFDPHSLIASYLQLGISKHTTYTTYQCNHYSKTLTQIKISTTAGTESGVVYLV